MQTDTDFTQTGTPDPVLSILPSGVMGILKASFKVFRQYWLIFLGLGAASIVPQMYDIREQILAFAIDETLEGPNEYFIIGWSVLFGGWFQCFILLSLPWIMLKQQLPSFLLLKTPLHPQFIKVYVIGLIVSGVTLVAVFLATLLSGVPKDDMGHLLITLLAGLIMFLFSFSIFFCLFEKDIEPIASIKKSFQLVSKFYFEILLKYIGMVLLMIGLFTILMIIFIILVSSGITAFGAEVPSGGYLQLFLHPVPLALLTGSLAILIAVLSIAFVFLFLDTLVKDGQGSKVKIFFEQHQEWLNFEK